MRSIRSRFLVVSVASVALAMMFAGFFFVSLFTRSLERRIDQELTDHIDNIAGTLRFTPQGVLELPERPSDRRFLEPYGGLYWQAEDDAHNRTLRSQSLWDFALPLPEDVHETGGIHRYHLQGPEGVDLIVQERKIIMAAPDGERAIRIAAAINASVITDARSDFALDTIPYVIALAVFLIAASLAQLTFGLRPISSVSEGLNRIRERKADRLTGRFPAEMHVVVDAVNRLLESQSEIIAKARAAAADLAHGLKTPLTVLSNDAETLREKGEKDIGDELAHLAAVMRAHVDHELARSRIAATAELRRSDSDLGVTVETIIRTLKRTPEGERLCWTVGIPAGTMLEVDPHDLHELIGNILENAAKWSTSAVTVRLLQENGKRMLVVEDDGPGAEPGRISLMTERGMRLDTRKPGTGIGLAIVRDIATVYNMELAIGNREQGGLRVSIAL